MSRPRQARLQAAFSGAAIVAAVVVMLCGCGPELAEAREAALAPQVPASGSKPTVYVADFEIDVLPARNVSNKAASAAAGSSAQQQVKVNPEEETRRRAGKLVELMSTKLVEALQKAGYTAVRMHRGDARPESGVQIRGLFAEVDAENHWRRAVMHTADESGKMQALVAVANLAKPEQTLYEIAQLPGNENKPGAVITLSPYVPLTKFDLSKDANEDAFQKIAPRVVDDLTALLNANPAAFSQ